MKNAVVAVIKTTPETVLADIERAMRYAGAADHLDVKKTTILKNNISWHMPFLSANTTPWQLDGTIQALRKLGCADLVCVENQTVVTNAARGERLNKYDTVLEKHRIAVKYNFRKADMSWVPYTPRGTMRVLNRIFPDGIMIPDYFFDKNIVHLPTVKTHIYTRMTGSMKNAFGGLLNTRRHYTHSWIHETLVDLLTIQKEIHTGIFTVMDGTLAGCGPGPRTMIPVEKDLILAGADSVAVDAISAKLMGFDPLKDIDFIRMAHDAGLGIGDPDKIEVAGEDISTVNWKFYVGDNLASRAGHFTWFGPLRWAQKLLFHTPLVGVFILASFLYHDYYWWPLHGKRIMEVIRHTKWGELFEKY